MALLMNATSSGMAWPGASSISQWPGRSVTCASPQTAQHTPQPVETFRQLNPIFGIRQFDCMEETLNICSAGITNAIQIESGSPCYVLVKQVALVVSVNLLKE